MIKNDIAYSIIKRAISDPSYLQDFTNNADALIQNEGLTDQALAGELKYLAGKLTDFTKSQDLSRTTKEWNAYYAQQLKCSTTTINAFKSGLCNTIQQIEDGFKLTSIMYNVAFYLGVGLIIFSVVFAVISKGSLLSIAFGGFGIADIITFFITKPPQHLQSSRADLAQLQLAYYNWFMDNYDWDWYSSSLYDWGGDADFVLTRMKEVSAILLNNTGKTMDLIEKYCEFIKDDKSRKDTSKLPNTGSA